MSEKTEWGFATGGIQISLFLLDSLFLQPFFLNDSPSTIHTLHRMPKSRGRPLAKEEKEVSKPFFPFLKYRWSDVVFGKCLITSSPVFVQRKTVGTYGILIRFLSCK